MTFSIVARCADGDSWGVAVASKFLAVGAVAPAAAAGLGALCTQADINVAWKSQALAHLERTADAAATLDRLVAADARSAHRQIGIVDAAGGAATHTGTECHDWAGGLVGDGFACQGNILVGPQVLTAMREAYLDADREPFSRRLLTALAAGDAAGGDLRGRQSAALLVVRAGAGYGGLDDVATDLRVDDHPDPVGELSRLLDLADAERAEQAAYRAYLEEIG